MTTNRRHLPDDLRLYETLKLTIRLPETSYTKLKYRALKNHCAIDGYIKRILNRQMSANQLPAPEPFIRHFPSTKSHPPEHIELTSPYPAPYLRYLDNLAENIPPHYGTGQKSRRRLIETLILIDLYDTGD